MKHIDFVTLRLFVAIADTGAVIDPQKQPPCTERYDSPVPRSPTPTR